MGLKGLGEKLPTGGTRFIWNFFHRGFVGRTKCNGAGRFLYTKKKIFSNCFSRGHIPKRVRPGKKGGRAGVTGKGPFSVQ